MKITVFVLIICAFMFEHAHSQKLPELIPYDDHGRWGSASYDNNPANFRLMPPTEIIRISISL